MTLRVEAATKNTHGVRNGQPRLASKFSIAIVGVRIATKITGGVTRCARLCVPQYEKCTTLFGNQNMILVARTRWRTRMQQSSWDARCEQCILCLVDKICWELTVIVGAWGETKSAKSCGVLLWEMRNFVWHPKIWCGLAIIVPTRGCKKIQLAQHSVRVHEFHREKREKLLRYLAQGCNKKHETQKGVQGREIHNVKMHNFVWLPQSESWPRL